MLWSMSPGHAQALSESQGGTQTVQAGPWIAVLVGGGGGGGGGPEGCPYGFCGFCVSSISSYPDNSNSHWRTALPLRRPCGWGTRATTGQGQSQGWVPARAPGQSPTGPVCPGTWREKSPPLSSGFAKRIEGRCAGHVRLLGGKPSPCVRPARRRRKERSRQVPAVCAPRSQRASA